MIKGFLHVYILIAIATGKTRLRSVKPLQKSRVMPGQPTANQNPYSGYALPPGIYTAPAYGTYGKYAYGSRAGPNPGAGTGMSSLQSIPIEAFPQQGYHLPGTVPYGLETQPSYTTRIENTPTTTSFPIYTYPPTYTTRAPTHKTYPHTHTQPPRQPPIDNGKADIGYPPNPVPPRPNSNPAGPAPNSYSPNYPNQIPTLNPNAVVPISPTPNNYGYQPNYPNNQYTPAPTSSNNPTHTTYPYRPLSPTQISIKSTVNMGYPPNSPSRQIPGSFERNQVGAVSLLTTSPPKEVKHGTNTGLYLAMLLLLPCTIGGCCIGRIFFTPKQGLFFPEPLMFAENPSHLSFPAGASYSQNPTRSSSMRADMGASRSHEDRRPSHHSDHRHSEHRHSHYSSADPHYETPGNFETPYEPVYDYGGTPAGNKGRMDPLSFLQRLI